MNTDQATKPRSDEATKGSRPPAYLSPDEVLGQEQGPVDPVSATDWQDAVNWADFYLKLESARLYGLVTGGARVNVERCEDILAHGRARGFTPQADNTDACLAALKDGG